MVLKLSNNARLSLLLARKLPFLRLASMDIEAYLVFWSTLIVTVVRSRIWTTKEVEVFEILITVARIFSSAGATEEVIVATAVLELTQFT